MKFWQIFSILAQRQLEIGKEKNELKFEEIQQGQIMYVLGQTKVQVVSKTTQQDQLSSGSQAQTLFLVKVKFLEADSARQVGDIVDFSFDWLEEHRY